MDQMQQPALQQGGGVLASLLYSFPFVVLDFLNYKEYKGQQVSCGVCCSVEFTFVQSVGSQNAILVFLL